MVGGCDMRKAARCGQRGVAAAGGHVEHFLARPHVGRLDEVLADELERCADDGEVAAGPAGLLPLLDSSQVGNGPGRCANTHESLRGR